MGGVKTFSIVFLILFFIASTGTCQEYSEYKKEYYVSQADTLPYRILLPKQYDPSRRYPLLLFLHGSGERGMDNELQLTHGADLFLRDSVRTRFPAIVVFPQCAPDLSWHNATYEIKEDTRIYTYPEALIDNVHQHLLEGLIAKLQRTYRLDTERLYVGGLSMGGIGTFELVRRNPELFAAAFVICGGANPKLAPSLRGTQWWLFHGEEDRVVTIDGSRAIYNALVEQRADVVMSVYSGIGHDSWTSAFADPELLPWLFSKKRLPKDIKDIRNNN